MNPERGWLVVAEQLLEPQGQLADLGQVGAEYAPRRTAATAAGSRWRPGAGAGCWCWSLSPTRFEITA